MDRRTTLLDTDANYAIEREFEDVVSVAQQAGQEVDVIGQSSGAICALGAAPITTNLRHLVLYEPPLQEHMAPILARMESMLAAGDYAGVIETFVRDGVGLATQAEIDVRKDSPEWKARIKLAPQVVRESRAISPWRLDPERYHSLEAPVLLLIGGNTPPNHHHRGYEKVLAGCLANLQIVEIPGQQHSGLSSAPDIIAPVILNFLEGTNSRSTHR
jgi:pimeloyl-ACP methyl ester carboxylesterase